MANEILDQVKKSIADGEITQEQWLKSLIETMDEMEKFDFDDDDNEADAE